jgi:iron complex outermembrane receptor protein
MNHRHDSNNPSHTSHLTSRHHRGGATWAAAGALPALLLLAHAPLQAQPTGETRLPTVRVESASRSPGALDEPADTGSRLGLTPLQTPASVEVLPGDTVRQRGDASLLSATSRATGVTASPGPGNGGTSLAARGFSGHGSVMQLFDGTRLYVGAGTVTFPFDPWSVERIEVLRGAASVMYGEGAIGAAVSVVPKKPTRGAIENEARVAFGSDSTRRVAFGSGGAIDGRWSYRVDASHNRSDGFMARGDSDSLALGGALRLDVSPQLHVTLSSDDGRQHPERYYGVPLIDGRLDDRNRRQNYNVGDAELSYRDRWTRLDAEWTPTGQLKLRNQLYHLDSRRHWRNSESYAYSPATGRVARSDYLEIGHDQRQTGNRFDASVKQAVFGLQNQVTAGFDVNRIHFQHTNDSPYGGASSVLPFDFDPGVYASPVAYSPRYRTRTDTHALFAEDRLALDERWSVVGGVRRDRAQVARTDLLNAANSFEKTFSHTTGRVGVVFAPTARQSVYAQLAKATDPLGSLITTSAAQLPFDLTTGRQVEVGYKQLLAADQGAWSVAAYRIEKKKLLSRDAVNPTLQQQIGQQSSQGLEATLDLALAKNLRLAANVAVLQARYDDFKENVGGVPVSRDGNTPAGVPERAANLWLDWRFQPQWQAGAGIRHVGAREVDSANTRQIGAYTVADATLGWQARRDLQLTLLVNNVLDRDYPLSTSNSGNQWLLGRPRSLELSAHLRF